MHLSDTIRESLDREVLGRKFEAYFHKTLRRDPALVAFDGPRDLLGFLHAPTREYERKDTTLRALLRAYQEELKTTKGGDPNRSSLGPFLLLALWPGLTGIVHSKRRRFRDLQELWNTVVWAFLEKAEQYPLADRPSRVAKNLQLDTLNKLCEVQRERCRQQNALKALIEAAKEEDEEFFTAPPPDASPLDTPAAPSLGISEVPPEDLVRACDQAVKKGCISDLDRLLITATRVYGHELKSYADHEKLDYERVKKRRQRAERIVSWFLQPRGGE